MHIVIQGCQKYWVYLLLLSTSLSWAEYQPSEQNKQIREQIEKSIYVPGIFSKAFWTSLTGTGTVLNYVTPKIIKDNLDEVGAYSINKLFRSSWLRNQGEDIAFKNENKVFAQYDAAFGTRRKIPVQPVSKDTLLALFQAAQAEREVWETQMSGGNYDGS